jgi:WD40 repeat protein
MTNKQLPMNNEQFPMTNEQLPITNDPFPLTKEQLPMTSEPFSANGNLELTLEGHKGPIYDLDWHRDGLLLSASGDCSVRIW